MKIANKNEKYHYYMFTVTFEYLRDGVPKRRTMNTLVLNTINYVTFEVLDNARLKSMEQLTAMGDVKPESVHNYIIDGINYLGYMTQERFKPTAVTAEITS